MYTQKEEKKRTYYTCIVVEWHPFIKNTCYEFQYLKLLNHNF